MNSRLIKCSLCASWVTSLKAVLILSRNLLRISKQLEKSFKANESQVNYFHNINFLPRQHRRIVNHKVQSVQPRSIKQLIIFKLSPIHQSIGAGISHSRWIAGRERILNIFPTGSKPEKPLCMIQNNVKLTQPPYSTPQLFFCAAAAARSTSVTLTMNRLN